MSEDFGRVQFPADLQGVIDAAESCINWSMLSEEDKDGWGTTRPSVEALVVGPNCPAARLLRRVLPELSNASARLLGGRPVRFRGEYFVAACEAALWCASQRTPCCQPERLRAACRREIIEAYRIRKRHQRRTLGRELIETSSEAVEAFMRRKQWATDPTAPILPCPVKRTDRQGTWLVRGKPKTLTASKLIASINALIDAYPRALTGSKLKGTRGVNGGDPGRELRKLARRDTDWYAVLLFPSSTREGGTRSNGRKGYGFNPNPPLQ